LAGGSPPYNAYNLVVNPGGTLTANANTLNLTNTLVNYGIVNVGGSTVNITGLATLGINNNFGASLNLSGGTINLGPAGGSNRTLTNNGTLSVGGTGTLNLNGNLVVNLLSTFNQSGGNINVDGNAGGVAANSVLSGVHLVSFLPTALANLNLTGGTFTIVDPHAATTASNVIYFSTSALGQVVASPSHTFRFGDGVSTDAGGNAVGFQWQPWVTTAGLKLGNVILNGPAGTNRLFSLGPVSSFNPLIVGGDLTINSGAELYLSINSTTAPIVVNGNLTVNAGGTITSL
jgi:hypothetical protein